MKTKELTFRSEETVLSKESFIVADFNNPILATRLEKESEC